MKTLRTKALVAALALLAYSAFGAGITTPNMGLVTPSTGSSNYPTLIDNMATAIDEHDHSSGKGVQVITGGITDLAVTSGKLAADAVTTAKILDLNVTTAKIADGAVTQIKKGAIGQQVSASSGAFSESGTTLVDVTNLSVTLTTYGRPVFLGLISDSGVLTELACDRATDGTSCQGRLMLLRDATEVYGHTVGNTGIPSANHLLTTTLPYWIDVVGAGTYTYKVQGSIVVGTNQNLLVSNVKLIAFEL